MQAGLTQTQVHDLVRVACIAAGFGHPPQSAQKEARDLGEFVGRWPEHGSRRFEHDQCCTSVQERGLENMEELLSSGQAWLVIWKG